MHFSVQLRQLGRGFCLVIPDSPQFHRVKGDTHPTSPSIQGIWAGLPKFVLGAGGRDGGQRWQLLAIISQMAFQNWPPSDGLVARSFLLATSSCHLELKLGPRPGPHPAHCPPCEGVISSKESQACGDGWLTKGGHKQIFICNTGVCNNSKKMQKKWKRWK